MSIVSRIRGALESRASQKIIDAQEGGGRHAAPDNMCTFTWFTRDDRGRRLFYACVNQVTDKARRQCIVQHLCRRYMYDCPDPQYNAATAELAPE
jgi:hypothetical protein